MLYKVRFKPTSPFITHLTSSTLFGAFCWAIHNLTEFGDNTLENVVFKDPDSLVVTNAFPAGYIASKGYNHESYNYVMDTMTGNEEIYNVESIKNEHCIVNRESLQSVKHWQNMAYIYDGELNIFIYSNIFSSNDMEKIISTAFLNGIGACKSTGYGQFKLIDITEVSSIISDDIKPKQRTNIGYLILSDYIPSDDDTTYGRYSARIIRGKTVNGDSKKPLCVINAGSCFAGDMGKDIFTIGRQVYDEATHTYTSGRAIAIRVSLD